MQSVHRASAAYCGVLWLRCPGHSMLPALQSLQGIAWCRGLSTALVHPVVTPRFVPSCTPALLQGLGGIAQRSACHLQSHISESLDNDAFVAQLHPEVTLDRRTRV